MITPTLSDPTLSQPSASPVASAKRAASYYRLRHGWNPLPSHRKEKRPIISFGANWEEPIADEVIEHWDRYDTPNIQLMCGVRWNLAVVDLDGPTGWAAWHAMSLYRPTPKTWIVRTGSGGSHLYFRIPKGLAELPSVTLWDNGERHSKVQLLADKSLVIAPPSHHVVTGERYRWITGPYNLPEPAELPSWVVEQVQQVSEKPRDIVPFVWSQATPAARYSGSGSFDRNSVVSRLSGDTKLFLAKSWGLRLTGRRTKKGWHECHALGREDRRPSAGFEPESGVYSEPHITKMSFFDLAVRLGAYQSWQDAVNSLGQAYGVTA